MNKLYGAYDKLAQRYKLFKLEAVGDTYVVCGAASQPFALSDVHKRILQMASDMVAIARNLNVVALPGGVQVRVYLHYGAAYGGVTGLSCPRYCFYGDLMAEALRLDLC